MSTTSRVSVIETLAGQLAELLSTQLADLREFARATALGEGTIQLERNLRALELRRSELYRQFQAAAFTAPPALIVAPNELELAEDN